MTIQEELVDQGWEKFLRPDALRGNLIAASVFLAAYETLRSSVIERVRGFFGGDFDSTGTSSKAYAAAVLSLDKSPLRASLLWLKDMSAIDSADIDMIDRIREHRNELAHNLPAFITTAGYDINLRLLSSIYELVSKVDRWWIREFEMALEPQYVGRSVPDSDIHSGTMIFIHLLLRVASGQENSALWEQFQQLRGPNSTSAD